MPEKRFRMGDEVEFTFGIKTVYGNIIEDRGPIGVGGRRLYRIEFRLDPKSESTSFIEMPAVELKLAQHSPSSK